MPGVFSGDWVGREDELAVGSLVEVVLEEQGRLLHERQGVFGEELAVAGVEIVVVEEVRRPARAGHPEAAGEVLGARALLKPLVVERDGSTTPRAPNMCLALISSQGTIDSM